jgi:peptidoglycan/xylan/chitin deacetylase (PgdA/CDA1 family)
MMSIPVIWSNDDITAGYAGNLEKQLAFLARWGVPGTFFIVPCAEDLSAGSHGSRRTIAQDLPLLGLIDQARSEGHTFHQHGYVHTPFESGVPDPTMMTFDQAVHRQYQQRRREIEREHTVDALVSMLDNGRLVWRKAFGEDSPGYRPAWGACCENLFIALEATGFEWVSWRIPSMTSWLWSHGQIDAPRQFRTDISPEPSRRGKLYDYALGGDYAFRIPPEEQRIEAMVELAMWEFEHHLRNGWPMVICSHWHGLEHCDGTGYAVHERLIPRLLGTGNAEFITMDELHRRTLAATTAEAAASTFKKPEFMQ